MAELCTAIAKSTGQRCTRPVVDGRNKCRYHGGKSVAPGPGHHSYKTGASSKAGKFGAVLGKELGESYQAARTDEALLSMRDDIALLDARTIALVKQLDTEESGRTWRDLRAAAKAFHDASRMPDKNDEQKEAKGRAASLALQDVWRLIERGSGEWAKWEDTKDTMVVKEKLVRSERKRVHEERLIISVESAQFLLTILTDAALRIIPDHASQQKLVTEFVRLSGRADLFGPQDGIILDAEYAPVSGDTEDES